MDYARWYNDISKPFRSGRASRLISLLDKGLVGIIALAYLVALCMLGFFGDGRLTMAIAVPAGTFLLVSIMRLAVNRKRPYETHDIEPLVVKSTLGKSFPSRHVASAVVIACTLAWLDPAIGVFAFAAAAVVCFTRIVGGVHYPTDVACAVIISLAVSALGFLAFS